MENKYEVWIEGYAATGEYAEASRLGEDGELFSGNTFADACRNAIIKLKWNTNYYNEQSNSYWGCRFYDNEQDARRSFG